MLVLTRSIDESIIINDNIEIIISAITAKKVKLAINAPKDIPIYRKEIHDAIGKINKKN